MKKITALLILAATTLVVLPAFAAEIPPPAEVECRLYVDPEGTWVVYTVTSLYGYQVVGTTVIMVDGSPVKSELVSTSGQLGRADQILNRDLAHRACVLFSGIALLQGDVMVAAESMDCDPSSDVQLVRPANLVTFETTQPGPPLPPIGEPGPRPEGSPRSLRMRR